MGRTICTFAALSLFVGACAGQEPADGRAGPETALRPADLSAVVFSSGEYLHRTGPPMATLAEAIEWFYAFGGDLRAGRNQIQDALIGHSRAMCKTFTTRLSKSPDEFARQVNLLQPTRDRVKRTYRFSETVLTISLGITCTIHGGVACPPTGASGAEGGSGYDIGNSTANLVAMVAKAINRHRYELETEIRKRQHLDITAYPLEAALSDAMAYHGECNAWSGVSILRRSRIEFNRPSLTGMTAMLKDYSARLEKGDLVRGRSIKPCLGRMDSPWQDYAGTACSILEREIGQLEQEPWLYAPLKKTLDIVGPK